VKRWDAASLPLAVLLTLSSAAVVFSILAIQAFAVSPAQQPPQGGFPVDSILDKLSGDALLTIQAMRGVTTFSIGGKTITIPPAQQLDVGLLSSQPVGVSDTYHENEPSIAVRPNNPSFVVAFMHYLGTPYCAAFRSTNNGLTWTGPILLPLPAPPSGYVVWCSDPVVRYSPDGSKVYAAYMAIFCDPNNCGNTTYAHIVVSRSTNNGQSWSPPVIAIAGGPNRFPDKPWLDVHRFYPGGTTNNRVYVTATVFTSTGCQIEFTSSTNGATSFATPQVVSTSPGCMVQGSRPIGGPAVSSSVGYVLVCWYNSEDDGWRVGKFDIRCRTSSDYGSNWGAEVAAVDDMYSELTYWLGPDCAYHRWWGGMFPSMMIGPDGVAHIVFTADLTRPHPFDDGSGCPEWDANGDGSPDDIDSDGTAGEPGADVEAGDIFYVRSPGPPYTTWSRPHMVSDDYGGFAQGYPTVNVRVVNGVPIVFVAWMDHRVSSWTGYPNILYSIFASWTYPGRWGWWEPNVQIDSVESMSDWDFIGDYIDSSTANTGTPFVHVIWTDRSDKKSIPGDIVDFEDDVWTTRVSLP